MLAQVEQRFPEPWPSRDVMHVVQSVADVLCLVRVTAAGLGRVAEHRPRHPEQRRRVEVPD